MIVPFIVLDMKKIKSTLDLNYRILLYFDETSLISDPYFSQTKHCFKH